ncbi:uncharacterized protein LOC34618920 [Cyclospora cayetanensis]|uniref:Uncharacterized protein LOC34618920 n=1 Tax=Cyclospora cayetanensis TaxID=88456 RepID=A0A6P6RXY9_9EIME|nr:uncharacterized protein LOC34618920 [Cyclospora cayetanensis]
MPPFTTGSASSKGPVLYAEGALDVPIRGPSGVTVPAAPLLPSFTASPCVLRARPGFFLPARKLEPAKLYMSNYLKNQHKMQQQMKVAVPTDWEPSPESYQGFPQAPHDLQGSSAPLTSNETTLWDNLAQISDETALRDTGFVGFTFARAAAEREEALPCAKPACGCMATVGWVDEFQCPHSGWSRPGSFSAACGFSLDAAAAREIAAAAAQGDVLAAATVQQFFSLGDAAPLRGEGVPTAYKMQGKQELSKSTVPPRMQGPLEIVQPTLGSRNTMPRNGRRLKSAIPLAETPVGRAPKQTQRASRMWASKPRDKGHERDSPSRRYYTVQDTDTDVALRGICGERARSEQASSTSRVDDQAKPLDCLMRDLEGTNAKALRSIVLRLIDCRRLETQIEADSHQLQVLDAILHQHEAPDTAVAHLLGKYGGDPGQPLAQYLIPPRKANLHGVPIEAHTQAQGRKALQEDEILNKRALKSGLPINEGIRSKGAPGPSSPGGISVVNAALGVGLHHSTFAGEV